jgi:hypothetical protein
VNARTFGECAHLGKELAMAASVRAMILLCLLLFAAAAQAAPVLDQEHAPVGNFGALAVANDRTVFQTFTVGIAGALTRIDVQVARQTLTTQNLDFSLWSTDAAGLPKTVLATASLPVTAFGEPFSFPFVSFDLGSGVPVAVGDVLAIALNSQERNDLPPPAPSVRYLWQYGGQYPRGAASVQVGSGLFPQTEDVHFRTFVVPMIRVTLEVLRGKDDRIHPGSEGLLQVAILSTDTFDASLLDVSTLRFGRTGTEAVAVDARLRDVNGDRRADLVLHFRIPDAAIQCGDAMVSIGGMTVTGETVVGSAPVVTVGCK